MSKYIKDIKKTLESKKNSERAEWSRAYMLHQFDFLGIVTAERRKISKEWMKVNAMNDWEQVELIVSECWDMKQREYQYFAVELMAFYKKIWQPKVIVLFEKCLTEKSWWDSVDHLASECLSDYFKKFPEQITPITNKWNTSSNIWLQRSSIMFQKPYKKDTNTVLLSKYILNCCHSKEFFVQKAIGWSLREFAKTNPIWVKEFVAKHETELAKLSKKEALKHL